MKSLTFLAITLSKYNKHHFILMHFNYKFTLIGLNFLGKPQTKNWYLRFIIILSRQRKCKELTSVSSYILLCDVQFHFVYFLRLDHSILFYFWRLGIAFICCVNLIHYLVYNDQCNILSLREDQSTILTNMV